MKDKELREFLGYHSKISNYGGESYSIELDNINYKIEKVRKEILTAPAMLESRIEAIELELSKTNRILEGLFKYLKLRVEEIPEKTEPKHYKITKKKGK